MWMPAPFVGRKLNGHVVLGNAINLLVVRNSTSGAGTSPYSTRRCPLCWANGALVVRTRWVYRLLFYAKNRTALWKIYHRVNRVRGVGRSALTPDGPIDDVSDTLSTENQTVDSRNPPPHTTHRVFGDGRFPALFPCISHRPSARYLIAWRRWRDFMRCRNVPPWITRSFPDWGDALIDFILFEARVPGNASYAIRCKISSLRLGRLLVGVPDFTEGGARYTKALRSFRRQGRISRKIPVDTPCWGGLNRYITTWALAPAIGPLQRFGPSRLGFSALRRLGFSFSYESVGWNRSWGCDAALLTDKDGDTALRIDLPRSKTDR